MFIALIIFLVILGIVALLIQKIPMEANILSIINIVFVLIAVFAVLDAIGVTHFGILSSIPVGHAN